jgi:hypothetical protein
VLGGPSPNWRPCRFLIAVDAAGIERTGFQMAPNTLLLPVESIDGVAPRIEASSTSPRLPN